MLAHLKTVLGFCASVFATFTTFFLYGRQTSGDLGLFTVLWDEGGGGVCAMYHMQGDTASKLNLILSKWQFYVLGGTQFSNKLDQEGFLSKLKFVN